MCLAKKYPKPNVSYILGRSRVSKRTNGKKGI